MSLFDVNKSILVGTITKNPELKDTSKSSVLKLSVVTNRSTKKTSGYEDQPTFHNISIWGKPAERLAGILQKGEKVYVEGRIDNTKYEKDGVTKYFSEIVADNIISFQRKAGKTQDAF